MLTDCLCFIVVECVFVKWVVRMILFWVSGLAWFVTCILPGFTGLGIFFLRVGGFLYVCEVLGFLVFWDFCLSGSCWVFGFLCFLDFSDFPGFDCFRVFVSG